MYITNIQAVTHVSHIHGREQKDEPHKEDPYYFSQEDLDRFRRSMDLYTFTHFTVSNMKTACAINYTCYQRKDLILKASIQLFLYIIKYEAKFEGT